MIGRLMAAFMLANTVILAILAIVPGYGWALLLFTCYELSYGLVIMVAITVRQLLTPDHLQGRVNTTGRLIAWSGQPAGALLGGMLAELMPIRLVFGLMTLGVAAGAGLAVWARCDCPQRPAVPTCAWGAEPARARAGETGGAAASIQTGGQ